MSAEDFRQPSAVISGPEDGQSLWQPLPSRGYVTVKFSPQNMPYDTFSSGIQLLPPGCHIREHGHQQNHELVFVYEGTGSVTIEGETTPLEPGSAVLFGRYARHRIDNTGDVDMKLFWVFMPPGLEDWFNAIGRPRQPGEPMPEPFPRPDNVAEVQERMRFVPPRS
jgi:mannose-6-phosphate isomerase-like protein (cupin superfamily)